MTYQTVITNYGEQLIANAIANNQPVLLKTMAIGDGNGKPVQPTQTQTALVNEVYRTENASIYVDNKKPTQAIFEILVPEDIGEFWVREFGLFDDKNNLVAVANCPDSYKSIKKAGSGKVQIYRMVLEISSSDAAELIVNDNAVYLTREAFDNFKSNLSNPDGFKMVGQCESIEQLRTIEPTEHNQRILVRGYYAGSNVGGGEFYADLNDKTTADNGGTVIVTTSGSRWIRVVNNNLLKLEDFGATADGVTDSGEAINRAFFTCAYRYVLKASKGTYITNIELKAPSGLIFEGVGIDSTVIKAGAALPANANLFTNKSNNYAIRTNKDRDIKVSNLHFDADWRGRYKIGDDINNQACGVKLSAVESCHFYKVRCSNAALHCFDVSADQYVNTGNISDTSNNRSDLVVFDSCEAFNPYRDDAFTTHNSGGIVFNNCRAFFDGSVSELQGSQQGFEADEGSYDVTFNNCIATGFVCGFQSKGHDGTMPAKRITFNSCLAVECGYGFMISVGTNPTGKSGYLPQSAKLIDCAIDSPKPNTHVSQPYSIYIYGADGVYVDGFSVNGSAKIGITHGAWTSRFK
ncbi:phage tail protein [Actinobacillus equuli subsp. haemolyticus]|uniref:phage tail-collar fiber domain-containing protein n=1 Tax=Actinobacillus equuli TaxID=718 RepID=UPI0024414EDC|nr:phage tail protein [Actinobacillus equuli]WGE78049.1 phage tail protein [Actinobacillus equuli subsp. haemolyticus]